MDTETGGDPPRFPENGSLPPLRSELELQVTEHNLHLLRNTNESSAIERVLGGDYSSHPDFQEAVLWLKRTLGTPPPERSEASRKRERAAWLVAGVACMPFAYIFPIWMLLAIGRYRPGLLGLPSGGVELVRTRSYGFWEREGPLTWVPPNGSTTLTITTSVGLSETSQREINARLGVRLDLDIAQREGSLSAGLGYSRARSETVITQEAVARSMTLRNDKHDQEVPFAIWRMKRRRVIDKLVLAEDELEWQEVGDDEYFTSPILRAKPRQS